MCAGISAHAATIAEFAVPAAFDNPSGAGPRSIVNGPDGKLWFVESSGGGVGNIDVAGNIQVFSIPGPYPPGIFGPNAIAAGSDGNLWFTDPTNNRIDRITPAGAITTFALPTANAQPFGITPGPDGNLWFTERSASRIGKITPAGAISEYPTPTAASAPAGITAAGGYLFFVETAGSAIGRITPQGEVAEFGVEYDLQGTIATGPDGSVWYMTPGLGLPGGCPRGPGHATVRNTAGELVTAYMIDDGGSFSMPYGIGRGADGNMAFTDQYGNNVGYIAPGGLTVKFRIPTELSEPTDIVTGPDGSLWFTETGANKIGRIADVDKVFVGGFE